MILSGQTMILVECDTDYKEAPTQFAVFDTHEEFEKGLKNFKKKMKNYEVTVHKTEVFSGIKLNERIEISDKKTYCLKKPEKSGKHKGKYCLFLLYSEEDLKKHDKLPVVYLKKGEFMSAEDNIEEVAP